MLTRILVLSAIVMLLLTNNSIATDVPELKGWVNDYAGLMTKEESSKLSRDLELYEASTSNQIYILTVPTIGKEEISSFSIRVADKWKAGRTGKDNGIIITIAKQEKKVRIEVGRGLQGVLPDLTCGRIIREDLPHILKNGEAAKAFGIAIPHIMKAVKGEYKGDGKTSKDMGKTKANENVGKAVISFLIFAICIVVTALIHVILSTLVGGGSASAIAYYFFGANLVIILLWGVIGAVIGFFVYHLIRSATGNGSDDGFFGGFFSGGDGGSFFDGGGGGFDGGGADGGCD